MYPRWGLPRMVQTSRLGQCSKTLKRKEPDMRTLSRRRLLKVGAGGAVAGLAVTAPAVAHADDDDDGALYVHIDGVVTGDAGTFKIDIDVAGTRDDLRGEGWDSDPDEEDPLTFCIYGQSGSISLRTVSLEGNVLLANDPANLKATVKTDINLRTGHIDWNFGGFMFAGEGRAIIAGAHRKPENDD
jgi:hypothetical protein